MLGLVVLISTVDCAVAGVVMLREMKLEFVQRDGRQVPWIIGVVPGIRGVLSRVIVSRV